MGKISQNTKKKREKEKNELESREEKKKMNSDFGNPGKSQPN